MILTSIVGEVISIILILLIVTFVIIYILKSKKRGEKCIGCPQSKTCSVKNLKEICSRQLKKDEE